MHHDSENVAVCKFYDSKIQFPKSSAWSVVIWNQFECILVSLSVSSNKNQYKSSALTTFWMWTTFELVTQWYTFKMHTFRECLVSILTKNSQFEKKKWQIWKSPHLEMENKSAFLCPFSSIQPNLLFMSCFYVGLDMIGQTKVRSKVIYSYFIRNTLKN